MVYAEIILRRNVDLREIRGRVERTLQGPIRASNLTGKDSESHVE